MIISKLFIHCFLQLNLEVIGFDVQGFEVEVRGWVVGFEILPKNLETLEEASLLVMGTKFDKILLNYSIR